MVGVSAASFGIGSRGEVAELIALEFIVEFVFVVEVGEFVDERRELEGASGRVFDVPGSLRTGLACDTGTFFFVQLYGCFWVPVEAVPVPFISGSWLIAGRCEAWIQVGSVFRAHQKIPGSAHWLESGHEAIAEEVQPERRGNRDHAHTFPTSR